MKYSLLLCLVGSNLLGEVILEERHHPHHRDYVEETVVEPVEPVVKEKEVIIR